MSDTISKRVLVIGATGALGSEVARKFGLEGWRVMLHGFTNADRLRELRGEVEEVEDGLTADITDAEQVAALYARVAEHWGGELDALAVCTGINPTAALIRDTDLSLWRKVIDVNLTGPFIVVKGALPLMTSAGGGSIVLISSIFGTEAPTNRGAYSAAKHGLTGLVQSVCREEASNGVRINGVAPGPAWSANVYRIFTEHARTAGMSMEAYVKQRVERIPAGRFVEPSEIGALVVALCDDSMPFVNGQVIKQTGGAIE